MTNCDPLTAGLLASGPCHRRLAPFALVEVSGPEAGDFLQRLCSQDVLALRAGEGRPAAFLDAKGKVLVTCLVGRDGERFLLEVQQHQQPRLLQLLERYHFTEKLQFAARPSVACETISLPGPERGGDRLAIAGERIEVRWTRRGVQFERWHASDGAALPRLAGRELDDATAECLRMAAGIVAVGLDTEAATLALEADLDDHCSATKGCFTGQEIVARIHTYGHTNRALALLHLPAGAAVTAPAVLHEPADDLAVGRVMRASPLPGYPVRVGLGFLPHDFLAIGTALRLADGTPVTVAGFGPRG